MCLMHTFGRRPTRQRGFGGARWLSNWRGTCSTHLVACMLRVLAITHIVTCRLHKWTHVCKQIATCNAFHGYQCKCKSPCLCNVSACTKKTTLASHFVFQCQDVANPYIKRHCVTMHRQNCTSAILCIPLHVCAMYTICTHLCTIFAHNCVLCMFASSFASASFQESAFDPCQSLQFPGPDWSRKKTTWFD